MKNLSNKELMSVTGGHDGTAYKVGQAIGNILEVVITLGIAGRGLKWFRNL